MYLPSFLPRVGEADAGDWARRSIVHGIDVLALTTDGADDPAQPLRVATRVRRDAPDAALFGDIAHDARWRPGAHAEHTAFLDGLTGGHYVSALTLPEGVDDSRRLDVGLSHLRRARRVLPPACFPMRLVLGGPAALVADLVARHAEGWFLRAGTSDDLEAGVARVRAAWTAAGRSGRPRITAAFHFALGEPALAAAEMQHSWIAALHGHRRAAAVIAGSATTDGQVTERVAAFAAAGADLVLASLRPPISTSSTGSQRLRRPPSSRPAPPHSRPPHPTESPDERCHPSHRPYRDAHRPAHRHPDRPGRHAR